MSSSDIEPRAQSSATSQHSSPYSEESAEVVEAAVAQFQMGSSTPSQGVGTQDLSGIGFTYRHDWGDLNGSKKLFLSWNAINARSRVFVAIGEGSAGGPDGGKFIGSAKYSLFNVAPTNGGVHIWLSIEWGTPIRLYVDYLVINV